MDVPAPATYPFDVSAETALTIAGVTVGGGGWRGYEVGSPSPRLMGTVVVCGGTEVTEAIVDRMGFRESA